MAILNPILLSLLLCGFAEAKETPRVLPKGIFRARLVGVITPEIKDTFNADGQVQGISHSLNRSVTINDLAASSQGSTQARLSTLISSLNTLQAGLGDQLASSELNSSFSLQQQISLFALEKGLTDRLSLGIRIPVVRRVVRNRFRVDTVNNAAVIGAMLGSLSPDVTAGLVSVSNSQLDTGFFENALFTSKGYKPPRDFEKVQLGDVEFGGKYNFFKNQNLYSSILLGVAAPTGAKYDLYDPFDKGNSREAWSYAAQLLQDFYPWRGVTLGGAAKVGYSFKDTRDRAVPKNETDSLPSLLVTDGQVQSVTRQRGIQLDTELSAQYRFPGESFSVWTAYQYSSKGKDTFKGPGNLYYKGLEKNSDWTVHSGEVGAEVSTIPAYRKGTFGLPLDISVFYNRVLEGKNTPLVSYVRMDLMVYF